jgi:hypothetical protein
VSGKNHRFGTRRKRFKILNRFLENIQRHLLFLKSDLSLLFTVEALYTILTSEIAIVRWKYMRGKRRGKG